MTLIPKNFAYANVENFRATGAPSTRAQGFFEALHSARRTIDNDFRTEAMMTLRVNGAAYRSRQCKHVTVKAEPLEVRLVMALEVFLNSDRNDDIRSEAAAFMSFFSSWWCHVSVHRGGPGRRGRY